MSFLSFSFFGGGIYEDATYTEEVNILRIKVVWKESGGILLLTWLSTTG